MKLQSVKNFIVQFLKEEDSPPPCTIQRKYLSVPNQSWEKLLYVSFHFHKIIKEPKDELF